MSGSSGWPPCRAIFQDPSILSANLGDAAAGRISDPDFVAALEAESADSRSAPTGRLSFIRNNRDSQVSSSLNLRKQRQRSKARSRHLKFCSIHRSWANLELCYSKWGEIPESYERFLLQLSENLDVAEDTNNLEGWTIQQMLSHASGDAFVGPNVVLQAIKDIRARHKRRSPMAVTVRISNITMWRKEVADWIKSTSDHILLVQETHLGRQRPGKLQTTCTGKVSRCTGGLPTPRKRVPKEVWQCW